MRNLVRAALCLLLGLGAASAAQAAPNLYTGSMNGAAGFGVSVPFAGVFTSPASGATQIGPNFRGVGIPGPTGTLPSTGAQANVTPAGGFTLPAGDFFVQTSYTNPNPTTPTIIYDHSQATLSNLAGSFSPNFFTAVFGTTSTVTFQGTGIYGTPSVGTVVLQPGAGFGGVMRIAGFFNEFLSLTLGSGLSTAALPLTPAFIGGPSVPNTTTKSFVINNTALGPITVGIKFQGFPWITGKVSVIQPAGLVSSLLTEIGANTVSINTSYGQPVATGSIKLVTGWLTHVPALGDENTGEYELNVTFLPEPSSTTLAAAAALFVVGAYRVRRGRRRP